MQSTLIKFWKVIIKDIPHFGYHPDFSIMQHLFRDILIAWGSGTLLKNYFGLDVYNAYLASSHIALYFSAGFEAGKGINHWTPSLNSHDFFDPLDWLISVFAGFGVFSYMTTTLDYFVFVKLIYLWLLGSISLYLINKILNREIINL
ncbi:MAG: hypothetical protein ACE5JB_08060 [bacterium]